MHLNLKITSAEAYFDQQGTDIAKVPEDQVRDLEEMLMVELNMYGLISTEGTCPSVVDRSKSVFDTMFSDFKELRADYEIMWGPYQSYLGY